jgi:putative ABC transport system substrate-binding protein
MRKGIARREFITLVGGVAAAWPLATRAQRSGMRRIGMLMNLAADDPESTARLTAFVQGLQEFGWTQGRNIRTDTRWAAARPDLFRRYAEELVALGPDVILAATTPCVVALQQATHNVPIVFAAVVDPVGAGFVASLARPGGNATGFLVFEYALSGKWPQLLKEIAPNVKRVAVIRDPTVTSGVGQFAAVQTAALALGLELSPVGIKDPGEIERSLNEFALGSNGGLIVPAVAQGAVYRDLIIRLAAKHQLPTIYPFRYFVAGGGLISYGPDQEVGYRLAAGYVDRILKGEKPADLPVQAPTRYELAVNLKTAKTLGLTVPPALLTIADEVIE